MKKTKYKIDKSKLEEYYKILREMEEIKKKRDKIDMETYDLVKDKFKSLNKEFSEKHKQISKEWDDLKREQGYYDIDFDEKEINVLKRIIGKIHNLKSDE
jgi:hypothetical protein